MTSITVRGIAAVSLLAGVSHIALAQDRADDTATLSTIIVTGVGPQRDTDELIGNSTAVSRDEIIETLQPSLGDTLDSQPGVATTAFGQGASRPVLRGLGAERVLVLTNGIGVIDASAASPDHQVASDGIDADKIEILRGPAALAYGGQAIGGVVNVIDGLIVEELPGRTASGEAYIAAGSVNDGEEGAVKGKFTAGPFVLSLSASARDLDDYDIPGFAESSRLRALEAAEHAGEDDHDHEHEHEHEEARDTLGNSFVETGSLAAGLSWIGDDAFAGVAVRQQSSTYGLPGHEHAEGEEEGAGGEQEHAGEMPFIDLEQTRYDLRVGAGLNFAIFTDIAVNLSMADYAHTEFEAAGEPGTRYESDGTEGRVEIGTSIGDYDGAIGLQGLDKSLGAFGDEAFITPTDSKATGVFVYQTREWDSGFGIEGGLRYDTTELDNQRFGKRDFDLFSGSVGAHHHWDNGLFVGAQLSVTERAPNESELFADGLHLATSQYELGDLNLDKERGINLEATARWRGDVFGVGANIFHAEFNGFIYLAPGRALVGGAPVSEIDGLPVFQFNQQDASFTGGEIYGDVSFEDGLLGADWRGKAGLDFVKAGLDGGGNVPLIPPLTLNTSLDADFGLIRAGASLTLAGDQDDPGAGELATDGYATLDLRTGLDLAQLGFGREGTELFLEARNVTDEEVRYATSVLKDTVPAPGRNIRAGVRVVF